MMESDSKRMRKGSPFIFTNLITLQGLDVVIGWIKKYALLEAADEPNLCR
jgi:urease accessory protein